MCKLAECALRVKGNVVSTEASDNQIRLAVKAMELKERGATAPDHPPSEDHGNVGIKSVPRPDYPPSGAFDAEGHRPVLERSRKER